MYKILQHFLLSAVLVVSALGVPAKAASIGTFSEVRSNLYDIFNLATGTYMESARNALITDGHTITALDGSLSAPLINGFDTFYLPLSVSSGTAVLSQSEISVVTNYVAAGGNLVLQGDYAGYNNLLTAFGATHNNFAVNAPSVAISNIYPALTDGAFGAVTSVYTGSASTFTLPLGGVSTGDGVVGVLADGFGLSAGSGTVVLFGEINSFDGPLNSNGFSREDGAILFRNAFALSNNASAPAPVPLPAALPLLAIGLGVLTLFRRAVGRSQKGS